jgi:hypothetical protein
MVKDLHKLFQKNPGLAGVVMTAPVGAPQCFIL